MRGLGWIGSGTGRATLFFAAIVLVTGVRFVGMSVMGDLHARPLQRLESPQDQYLHSSLVSIFVGHTLGAVSPRRMRALSLSVMALALSAVLLYGHRAVPDPAERWTFFRLLALSPLIHVLVFWLGKSDPYLVAGYFLLLLSGNAFVVAALALGMTLTHLEQATVLLAVHGLLHRPRPAVVGGLLAGWLAGLAVHQAYLVQLGLAGSPRVSWLWDHPDVLGRNNLARPYAMLALSFSWFWIPLFAYLRDRRGWTLPLLSGACFAVAMLAMDFTRVFTLVALPLIVHVARELAHEGAGTLRPRLGALTGLGFLQMELAVGRIWDNAWALMLVRRLGVDLRGF